MKSGNITCDNDISYKYKIGQILEFERSRIPKDNTCEDNVCSACDFNLCVMLAWEDSVPGQNGTIFLSYPYSKFINATVIPTIVSKDLSGNLEELTKKLLKTHSVSSINDDGVIRRSVLFGSRKIKCDIAEKDRDVTKVTLWPLVVSIVLCSLCWVLLILSVPFRCMVFFKMNDPMDWAFSMRKEVDHTGNKEAFLGMRDFDSNALEVKWIDCNNTKK